MPKLEPAEELAIARGRRREALDAEQRTSFVECGRHVDVEVRVDPSGNAPRDSGHRHPFLRWGGWHRTSQTMDRTAMGLCGRLL
jgi:hypothetical protein